MNIHCMMLLLRVLEAPNYVVCKVTKEESMKQTVEIRVEVGVAADDGDFMNHQSSEISPQSLLGKRQSREDMYVDIHDGYAILLKTISTSLSTHHSYLAAADFGVGDEYAFALEDMLSLTNNIIEHAAMVVVDQQAYQVVSDVTTDTHTQYDSLLEDVLLSGGDEVVVAQNISDHQSPPTIAATMENNGLQPPHNLEYDSLLEEPGGDEIAAAQNTSHHQHPPPAATDMKNNGLQPPHNLEAFFDDMENIILPNDDDGLLSLKDFGRFLMDDDISQLPFSSLLSLTLEDLDVPLPSLQG